MSKWRDIKTEPNDGTSYWVGGPCGPTGSWGMEPVRRRHPNEAWSNIYTERYIEFSPTMWHPLPAGPKPTPITEGEK